MDAGDCSGSNGAGILAGQFAEEFPLVHAVLKRLAAVNEDDGNFVVELAAEFEVGVNVDLAPGEAAAAGELRQALFDHLAQMASLSRIDYNAPGVRHGGILARRFSGFQSGTGRVHGPNECDYNHCLVTANSASLIEYQSRPVFRGP